MEKKFLVFFKKFLIFQVYPFFPVNSLEPWSATYVMLGLKEWSRETVCSAALTNRHLFNGKQQWHMCVYITCIPPTWRRFCYCPQVDVTDTPRTERAEILSHEGLVLKMSLPSHEEVCLRCFAICGWLRSTQTGSRQKWQLGRVTEFKITIDEFTSTNRINGKQQWRFFGARKGNSVAVCVCAATITLRQRGSSVLIWSARPGPAGWASATSGAGGPASATCPCWQLIQ